MAATLRNALAAAIHPVFVVGLPLMALAFVATLFIEHRELRRTVHEQPAEACARAVRRDRGRVRRRAPRTLREGVPAVSERGVVLWVLAVLLGLWLAVSCSFETMYST